MIITACGDAINPSNRISEVEAERENTDHLAYHSLVNLVLKYLQMKVGVCGKTEAAGTAACPRKVHSHR